VTHKPSYEELEKRIKELEKDALMRKQAEDALQLSESRLRRAEVVALFGNWEFILGCDKVKASEGAKIIYGLEDAEWSIPEVQRIPLPEYRGMLDKALSGLIDEGKPYNVEFKIRRPTDGKIIDIHSIAEYSPEKRVVFGVIQDITDRKRAQEALLESNARISHLNDVLRAIRDVGSLINSVKDPIELLNAVCHSLVQTRGYVVVWIGKPEADSKRVLMVACSEGGGDFLQHAPITWDDSPTGQGPAGTAMRERRAVVFDNLATDPRFSLWRDPVVTYGGASIASIPLIHQERLLGVLTVKADRPHAFDLNEV
jgi:PAS domain S-box-containing protein